MPCMWPAKEITDAACGKPRLRYTIATINSVQPTASPIAKNLYKAQASLSVNQWVWS